MKKKLFNNRISKPVLPNCCLRNAGLWLHRRSSANDYTVVLGRPGSDYRQANQNRQSL